MSINSLNSFLQYLEIPQSCELNKPIYKKMFLDNGVLDATDKACLRDDIEKIRWLYTLKTSTINIAPYNDKNREYAEIAILHVELSTPKRIKRIAYFINRSIPYPLVLLVTCDIEKKPNILISLADKRSNQADKEKWVIEDSIHSDWIELTKQSDAEAKFLESLRASNLPFTNFLAFYQALMDRIVAVNCANHTGIFKLSGEGMNHKSGGRLDMLRELEKLDVQKTEVASRLKKEKQMGRQIDLNTQLKNINDKIAQIKGSL